jgi:hypothetical protein
MHLPDQFFTFIGALDATYYSISTQKVVMGLMPVTEQAEQSGKIQPQTVPDEKPGVQSSLKTLMEIKFHLLEAEARLGRALHPRFIAAPGPQHLMLPIFPTKQQVEAAWKEFYTVMDKQSGLFYTAVNLLIGFAPEWSHMDTALTAIMTKYYEFAKAEREGGGDDHSLGSWGDVFSSSGSGSGSGSGS